MAHACETVLYECGRILSSAAVWLGWHRSYEQLHWVSSSSFYKWSVLREVEDCSSFRCREYKSRKLFRQVCVGIKKNDSIGSISPVWLLFKKEKEQTKQKYIYIYHSAPRNRVKEAYICIHSGFPSECFLCPHWPKFFYTVIGLSCNCYLSWYARDAGFSHMYIVSWKQQFLFSVKTLLWDGVGEEGAIYYWLLFHYLFLDNISILLVLSWLNFVFWVNRL